MLNSKYILSNKRFGWIDYDRGISIILVAYRHCFESMERSGLKIAEYPWLEYINVFFFGFRMPLFFIASGMFISGSLRKKGLKNYQWNRVQNILYPMLLWGVIQISLQLIFAQYTNSNGDITAQSYLDLLIDPRKTGQFWYLNALFSVGIVYAFLKSMVHFNIKHQLLLGFILYSISAYVNMNGIEIWMLNDFFKYYLFFAIGDLVSNFMLDGERSKIFTNRNFVIPLIIAFITIQYFFTQINLNAPNKNNYYVENHMPHFFLLVALVGCAVSISLSFYLKSKEKLKFLRVVGYHSVHIYCIHILVIGVSRNVYAKLLGIHHVPTLMLLILSTSLIAPILIYNLGIRMHLWWLFSLRKPKEELEFLRKAN